MVSFSSDTKWLFTLINIIHTHTHRHYYRIIDLNSKQMTSLSFAPCLLCSRAFLDCIDRENASHLERSTWLLLKQVLHYELIYFILSIFILNNERIFRRKRMRIPSTGGKEREFYETVVFFNEYFCCFFVFWILSALSFSCS
jgi:hypothetical protein